MCDLAGLVHVTPCHAQLVRDLTEGIVLRLVAIGALCICDYMVC